MRVIADGTATHLVSFTLLNFLEGRGVEVKVELSTAYCASQKVRLGACKLQLMQRVSQMMSKNDTSLRDIRISDWEQTATLRAESYSVTSCTPECTKS
jgi:hypothetical protein